MDFAAFDASSFLRDCWQKHPALIRNPWRDWANPLSSDELAGLACEEIVESRLVSGSGTDLRLEHGPFADQDFARPAGLPWTLLVQAVDQHVPEVAALLTPFRFVPNWRIDDVMVSYATDCGGVGPHFDQYDVFLIQGLGRRRWQIGARCTDETRLLAHTDLRLLADFEPIDEWVLEPGDILYVPPGIAHNGIAVGDDCMTYSVGFRAPSRAELISDWCDHLMDELGEADRYSDPGLQPTDSPGEIPARALDRLHSMVAEALGDRNAFARWFAQRSTVPKYPGVDWVPERPITAPELRQAILAGGGIFRNPASRFSFIRQPGGHIEVFVDGESYLTPDDTSRRLGEAICNQEYLEIDADVVHSRPALELLLALINRGSAALTDG